MKNKKWYSFAYQFFWGFWAGLWIVGYLSQHINPIYGGIFYFFSLFVGYIQVSMWICILWAILKKKKIWTFGFLFLQLLGIQNYYVTYAFSGKKDGIKEENIKILSYNLKNFELGTEPIIEQIASQQPDIVCLQEVWDYKKIYNSRYNFPYPLKNLQDRAKLPYFYFYPKMQNNFGLAILSKYPIVYKGNVPFKSNGVNGIMYVDIRYKNQIMRVYNVHLQSINLTYNPKYEHETGKIKYDTPDKRKYLLQQLSNSAKKRSEQVSMLMGSMRECNYPVIIAGDLNSTPYTYVYRQLTQPLQDNFIVSGRGFGYTFNTYPLRIDYIFTDKRFKVLYTYCESSLYSDHKILISYVKL